MTKRLFVWNYYGGKNRPLIQEWILSNLPDRYESYVEPFAGSLGILINRQKSKIEVANDINGRIINWWKVAQTNGAELERRIDMMPHSERLYYELGSTIDEGDELERAVKFHYTVSNSRMHTDLVTTSNFTWRINGTTLDTHRTALRHIDEVRKRIQNVTLLDRPAQKLLKRTADEEHTVIYCDPPYASANTTPYEMVELDELTDLLKAQKGSVAISGYGTEWDHLGWRRDTLSTRFSYGVKDFESTPRTEVLWMNYEPPQRKLL